jgi:competence protein ComEC
VLHKEIPFLRIVLPLCAGITTGLYYRPTNPVLYSAPLFVAIVLISDYFVRKKGGNTYYGMAISVALFMFGLILYTNEKQSLTSLKPETTVFNGKISDFPAEKENTYMITVEITNRVDYKSLKSVHGSIILYSKKDSGIIKMVPGDLIKFKCSPVEIMNRGNPYEFDYKFYMENQGIKYYAFITKKDILLHTNPQKRSLAHKALIIREKIIAIYKENGITGDRLALVAAMTLGQRNMLDQEQKQNFIQAGVMHIMAVSGLHSVILSLFVFNLLFFLKRKYNILRTLITIIIIWIFAYITGLTASVLRATLMFTFLQTGLLLKRPVNSINSVLASALILMIIKPSVIFDAGFLLSYSAVIFIILFYYDFYLKLQFKRYIADKIWQSAAVTIIAQTGTLSLTIYLFGRFPTYFIITNILIVPLSSLLIIIGCIVPLVSTVPFLVHPACYILNFLTGLTEYLTAKAASLPFSTIENIGSTIPGCILLSLVILVSGIYILKRKQISVLIPISALLLLMGYNSFRSVSTRNTNEIIVYNTPGSTNLGIRTGKIINLYSDTSATLPDILKHCSTLGLKLKHQTITSDRCLIKAGEKKILITEDLNESFLRQIKPDYVILSGKRFGIVNIKPGTRYNCKIIAGPKSVSGFKKDSYITHYMFDTIHIIKTSGAYVERF